MIPIRCRSLAFAIVVTLLLAGVAQSAPSRVEVVTRGPQAQEPGLAQADEDPGKPGTQVKPRAGGSHGFPADVIVHDENGHNDVRSVNVTILRADNATVHKAAVAASKLSASGTRATWRATVTMNSSDEPGTYIIRAAALDRDAAVSLAWTNFTYEPLAALTLARENVSLAPAGSMGFQPGADTSATPVGVNVTNGGNVPVNLTLSATPLSNATHGASMPASSLQASRTTNASDGIALAGTSQTLPGGSIAADATVPLYFSVRVPQGLRAGEYVGELTVGAIAAG